MYAHIRAYAARNIYPFHMPGHKRNPLFFLPDLMRYDLTEIPEMDVLHEPTGFLREWQEELAAFFGADESFFLVNGASAGVVAAICAVCGDGDVLFAARNGHASMYNGMALAGAVPRYFFPRLRADGLAGSVDPTVFDAMPEGAAAFVVSPTYEGFVSDIAEIARRVRARGGLLIVDEAHGAHFAFHDAFPCSALRCGADIVVHSLHKTLPVPGQCALLHVRGDRVDRARLRFFLNAVQTTSPSYMLMAAADYALRKLWREPALFEDYVNRLARMGKDKPCADTFAIDPGKKLFYTQHTPARDIAALWAQKYKIQVEMAYGNHLLAMTSAADTEEGFARLARAVAALEAMNAPFLPPKNQHTAPPQYPEVILSPREALQCPTLNVPAAQAVGRIAGELVAPCPPGIALVAPGERIPAGADLRRARIAVISRV